MIHIFKNLNFGGLLALVLGVVLMVSWKAVESGKAAPQWYEVELKAGGSTSNLNDFEIKGLYPGGAPEGNCNTPVTPEICAVQLDLNGTPMPSTIAEANTLGFDTSVRRHLQD